jgi:hypothetical protein
MSKALEQLKAQADSYGISYHPSIGEDKLQEKIDAFLKEKAASVDSPVKETTTTKAATPSREELLAEASKLVRVNISCMNPAKKDWDGEIITAGNSLIGTFRKFVKFNTAEGYHVPQVIFNVLKNRKFQTFHNVRTKNGVTQRAARLVPEFSIEVLPQLTEAELAELAKNQAARG